MSQCVFRVRRLSKQSARFDQAIYESESATADRNRCLGHLLKNFKAFPDCCTDLTATLELYFQFCSITSTRRGLNTYKMRREHSAGSQEVLESIQVIQAGVYFA